MITFQERLKTEPSIWATALQQLAYSMRVAAPGIIQSFNAENQTAVVQLAIMENVTVPVPQSSSAWNQATGGTIAVLNSGSGQSNSYATGVKKSVAIAPLPDVPVVFPRSGGFSVLSPVNPGDECLVIFADSCIDGWFQSGGVQKQIRRRRHSLSDAFALVGIWSQPRVFPDFPTDHIELRSDDGAVKLKLSETQVQVVTPANTPQTLMTNAFYEWFLTYFLAWAKSSGYTGVNPPNGQGGGPNSITKVLESE